MQLEPSGHISEFLAALEGGRGKDHTATSYPYHPHLLGLIMPAFSTLDAVIRRVLVLVICSVAAAAQQSPSLFLNAPNLTAQPGQTVTVPITLDNILGEVQGWSFTCNIPMPSGSIVNEMAGSTTLALNSGSGPSFLSASVYPGQGFTVGCVINFLGAETLPIGGGYNLHTCQVTVPANAAPGTVYPITFDSSALGTPPVATVIVHNGFSYAPTIVSGSITVGDPATVTSLHPSDCPGAVRGTLASPNTPVVGTQWDLQIQGTPAAASHGIYVFGLSQTPTYMAAFGSPCTLQVTPDVLALGLAFNGNVQPQTLPIPNSMPLLGTTVYVQGMHDIQPVAPFSTFLQLPIGYYFTNTLAGTIGL